MKITKNWVALFKLDIVIRNPCVGIGISLDSLRVRDGQGEMDGVREREQRWTENLK